MRGGMPPAEPTPAPVLNVSPIAIGDLERRMQWRFVSVIVFGGLMVALAVAAALSLLAPRRIITGLPDDPDAALARALMRSGAPPATGELRFESALTGESRPGFWLPAEAAAAAERAQASIERARRRARFDPRLIAALGHVELARRMFGHAEDHYRVALEIGPHYGEAHLGLGVALALRGETEADPLRQRGLRLEALAQFIAVREGDPAYLDALYDRARVLEQLGRSDEARAIARAYLRRDPSSAWARSLANSLGLE